jgi:flagellar basal body rod protein FlgG
MSNVVSSIARYLSNDVQALDVVSQNVANMRTNGYRTERLKTDFRTGTIDPALNLDLTDGNLEMTGRPLDVAIQGSGFFVVDVGGQAMLTRNGQFHIDADRQLVDASGHPVLGQAGPIQLTHERVHINPAGEILEGGKSIDSLQIMAIADPSDLHVAGGGLYTYAGRPGTWNGSIHQGALERSNVDGGTEMVRLMELTRHAQSVQRALQAYDQAMQFGINHIGDNT